MKICSLTFMFFVAGLLPVLAQQNHTCIATEKLLFVDIEHPQKTLLNFDCNIAYLKFAVYKRSAVLVFEHEQTERASPDPLNVALHQFASVEEPFSGTYYYVLEYKTSNQLETEKIFGQMIIGYGCG